MIIFFSFLTDHEYVIKEESATHGRRVHDLDILELRFFVVKHLVKGDSKTRKLPVFIDPVGRNQNVVGSLLLSLFQVDKVFSRFQEFLFCHHQALNHSSGDKPRSAVQAFELIFKDIHTLFRLHLGRTSEHIHSSISELGPSMDGHMRFCNHHHTTYPKGFEVMEIGAYDCSVAYLGTVKKVGFNVLRRVQWVKLTVIELCDVMFA